jgi:hypothetical protein
MKKIAFYQPHLDIQGTGVSYFDYATHNETILGNKSYMICDKNHPSTHLLSTKKFKDKLDVIELDGNENMCALERTCKDLNVDALYIQKCGRRYDGRFLENIPTFIHVVGVNNEPHGTVYAYVSEWLSQHCSNYEIPFIPYMTYLPDTQEDLKKQLNIPEDAIVFGRTGGPYSWNIPFVNSVIKQILNENSKVYFLFANTNKFMEHERVIFHAPFADLEYKRKFINTTDAFLHARAEGESFGASVAEFSLCNKPVITFANSPERNHIFTLKDKGIYYTGPDELYSILKNFNPQLNADWNAYRDFTPGVVMKKFKEVFIDKL